MFEGFNESTIAYYEAVRKENNKAVYKDNEMLYLEGVKYPLEQMYYELYAYFDQLDVSLLGDKRRCISSAYNDARFCKDNPIKEYFYIKFKLDKTDKKNALGFFMDASTDGYRYGLNIYNMDAKGMEKIREEILDNKYSAAHTIQKFNQSGLLKVEGEKYKKPPLTQEDPILQKWLQYKRISFVQEEIINPAFFDRRILEDVQKAFDSVRDVYFMLKEALEI